MFFNGEKLYLVAEQDYCQSMGYVFTSRGGKVVVIDGGTADEAAVLEEYLLRAGKEVEAWFITHAHYDHLGAAVQILRGNKVDIKRFCFAFPEFSWLEKTEPNDAPHTAALLREIAARNIPVEPLRKGKEFVFDSLKITALNDAETDFQSQTVNNSTVALDVKTSGASVLFLGDMERESGDRLVAAYPDLHRDIVQVAHHGNRGVGKNVYEHVRPRVCLWNTPVWLWNNDDGGGYDSGSWTTLETRRWAKELGVEENIVSKDGCREIV
ncbi:MAG: MBL fold hydrolase [Bacillota bacterium]|nr:MAG: MBL fold hydrolase [Bacillota bacterium]